MQRKCVGEAEEETAREREKKKIIKNSTAPSQKVLLKLNSTRVAPSSARLPAELQKVIVERGAGGRGGHLLHKTSAGAPTP